MSKPEPSRDKSRLRRIAREQRRAISRTERPILDEHIRQHFLNRVNHCGARTLSAFLSFDDEPDLLPALNQLAEAGHTIVLPVIDPAQPGAMRMRKWRPDTAMQTNAFGIMEPAEGRELTLDVLDLVLLPLVAYDETGTRLGLGGGYYDRWLRPAAGGKRPLRVGVAYLAQQLPGLPRDAWDVPLDAIVNEQGWFAFPL